MPFFFSFTKWVMPKYVLHPGNFWKAVIIEIMYVCMYLNREEIWKGGAARARAGDWVESQNTPGHNDCYCCCCRKISPRASLIYVYMYNLPNRMELLD